MAAVAFVGDLDAARRDFEREPPLDLGRHQSFLQRHRDGADRAVAAHRQAAADLDEQHAEVAIWARGRVEDRTRHDVVAPRLEHQSVADPIVLGQEDLALLGHRDVWQDRAAARDDPDRVAAGVSVDAEEGMGLRQGRHVRRTA